MAITYVDAAVANYTAAVETYSVAVPSGVQAGDVAIIQITTASADSNTFTPPVGSVELVAQTVCSSSRSQVWYLPLLTAPAEVAVTLAAAHEGALAVMFIRGVQLDDPLASEVELVVNPSGAATDTVPSVTTIVTSAYVLGGLFQGSGSATWTPPTGWTIRADGTRRNGILATKGVQVSAGNTGEATWTMPSANAGWAAWQVAFAAADSEPPTPPIAATLTSEPYPGFSGDVTDGAAIIPDPTDASRSVVLGTNKAPGGGLYVLDLAGEILSSNLDGAANSVDWRAPTGVGWDGRVLVLTVDRDDDLIRYYWFDRSSRTLTSAGSTALDYEPYGSCLYVHSTGDVYAFISDRGDDDFGTHNVRQYLLTRSGNTVSTGSPVRTISEDGVMEGMAADDLTGGLFVSREDHGLYRYAAAPDGGSTRTTVDTVGAGHLVDDVEDVAVARSNKGAWLLVSSQGDSSYHVYDLDTFEHEQRFTIVRPNGSTQVQDTDGLDVLLAPLGGGFPDGLIVVHDGSATPISNFAFVDAALVFGALPASPGYLGSAQIIGAYVGSSPVGAIYVGDLQITS